MSVAVIGWGDWGKNLIRVFHKSGILSAICDNDKTKIKRNIKPYEGLDYYTDHKELLMQQEIHAVVVATPASTHFEIVRDALLADKDVFVEKPLALSYSEGQELVVLAEEKKWILMVGHILEYHPAIEKMKAMIEEGKIGQINYIYSSRLNLGKFRKEENVLWSFAPHDISLILSILDEMPERTMVRGGAYLNKETMDVTVTHMEFSNNVKAHIFVSWLHPYKEQRFVVIGSRGMLVFDNMADDKLAFYPSIKEKVNPTKIKTSSVEPLELECRHFIECMAMRKEPRTSGKKALRVLEILTNSGEQRPEVKGYVNKRGERTDG